MLLEEDVDAYIRERGSILIKNIANILSYTFLFFTVCYLFCHTYFETEKTFFLLFYFTSICFAFFFIRHIYLKKDMKNSILVMSTLLFSFYLVVSLKIEGALALKLLVLTIAFILLTITKRRKTAITFVAFSLLFSTLIRLFQFNSFFLSSNFNTQNFYKLKTYWFFLLLLYILYESFSLKTEASNYRKICVRNYRRLAVIEYRHRLLGKLSKCLIHDISTPLSVLTGTLKLLSDSKLQDSQLSEIKESAANSLCYLDGILSDSYLILRDIENKIIFSPDSTVKKVLSILKTRTKESGIILIVNLRNKEKIFGNESFFARAVLNVLINSIEELEVSSNEVKRITVYSEIKDGYYNFCVEDCGNGLGEEIIRSIKEMWYSTKSGNHLGLGLYFVLDTVECHFSGKFCIKSDKGKFTRVVFEIPLHEKILNDS